MTGWENNYINYYNAVQQVEKCKADCLTKYPPGSPAESFNKQACKGGCDLKGPYVSKCEDTFTKSRIASLGDCASATKGKCMDGNVVLGQDSFVDDINNADSNNVTLRKGCCVCGGGGGGPPTTTIRGKTVKNCNEMPAAFGYNGSSGNYIKNSCLTAPVASPQNNANLYNYFLNLSSVTNTSKTAKEPHIPNWSNWFFSFKSISTTCPFNVVIPYFLLDCNLL